MGMGCTRVVERVMASIGKLSEGSFKGGVKHSFALVTLSFVISAAANIIFGG